jgi:hypothetical protein
MDRRGNYIGTKLSQVSRGTGCTDRAPTWSSARALQGERTLYAYGVGGQAAKCLIQLAFFPVGVCPCDDGGEKKVKFIACTVTAYPRLTETPTGGKENPKE